MALRLTHAAYAFPLYFLSYFNDISFSFKYRSTSDTYHKPVLGTIVCQLFSPSSPLLIYAVSVCLSTDIFYNALHSPLCILSCLRHLPSLFCCTGSMTNRYQQCLSPPFSTAQLLMADVLLVFETLSLHFAMSASSWVFDFLI